MESYYDHFSLSDSSPSKCTSFSSSSETHSKFSSTSVSDDDLGVWGAISNAWLSQVEKEDLKYSMDSPSYVPQGILSNLSKPAYTDTWKSEPEYFQSTDFTRSRQQDNFSYLWKPSGDLPPRMMTPQPRNNSNYPVPLQFHLRMPSGCANFRPHLGNELFVRHPMESLLMPDSLPSSTKIHIYTNRKVNFAESVVPFIIEVCNPPDHVQIQSHMLEAMVVSPQGNMIRCRVRNSESYIFNSFVGLFRANEEAGNYEVRVKMTIPLMKSGYRQDRMQLGGNVSNSVTHIPVSKNYGLDTQRDCVRISCGLNSFEKERMQSESQDDDESDDVIVVNDADNNGQDNSSPSAKGAQQSFLKRDPCTRGKMWGLTCDLRNNNILYTDREAHQAVCISPSGDVIFKFGKDCKAPPNQQLYRPAGIAFDEVHNRFIICDKDNHRVCFFSLDGQFLSSFGMMGHKNGFFQYPWDVAVSPNGTIAVCDSKNKRIQFFDTQGNFIDKYTVFEKNPFEFRSQFDYPRGICFDHAGNYVYVSDFNVNNVLRIPIDLSGHQKLLPSGTLLRPQGIAMDSIGNLIVTDSRHNCVRLMNTKGEHLYTIREIVKKPIGFPVNVTTMAGGFTAVMDGSGNITIF